MLVQKLYPGTIKPWRNYRKPTEIHMDNARIEEIYNQIVDLFIPLAPDPRTMGPGYISATVAKIQESRETVNGIFNEVQRARTTVRNRLSLLELDLKTRRRNKLLSPEVQSLEIASAEKMAHAEKLVDEDYETEIRRETPDTPRVISLEEQIVQEKAHDRDLDTLLEVLKEKKSELNRTDSDLRLQQSAVETEAKLFYGGQTNPLTNGHTRTNRTPNGPVNTDPQWGALTGENPTQNDG
jgi:hypothetical protein